MNDILDLWQLSDVWIAPIKFSFVLLCLLCIIDLGSRGRFRLINVSIALFVILLFFGLTGTLLEIVNAFEPIAVPGMPPDKKASLLYAGLSRAPDNSILALWLALPCLWLMALSRVIRKEEQSIDSKDPTH